jgi:hypothetical protein
LGRHVDEDLYLAVLLRGETAFRKLVAGVVGTIWPALRFD